MSLSNIFQKSNPRTNPRIWQCCPSRFPALRWNITFLQMRNSCKVQTHKVSKTVYDHNVGCDIKSFGTLTKVSSASFNRDLKLFAHTIHPTNHYVTSGVDLGPQSVLLFRSQVRILHSWTVGLNTHISRPWAEYRVSKNINLFTHTIHPTNHYQTYTLHLKGANTENFKND
jgi:hypothetical protein